MSAPDIVVPEPGQLASLIEEFAADKKAIDIVELDLRGGRLFTQRAPLRLASLALLRVFGLADGLGARITFSLQCFGAGLDGLALFFQRFDARNIQGKATGCQAVRYVLKVAT